MSCDPKKKEGPCAPKVLGTATTTVAGTILGAAGGPVGMLAGAAVGAIFGKGRKWCKLVDDKKCDKCGKCEK